MARPPGPQRDASTASETIRGLFELLQKSGKYQSFVADKVGFKRSMMSDYKFGLNTPSILRVEEMGAALGYKLKWVREDEADAK